MLKLIANGFSTHKAAETPDDCQDALAMNEGTARYAVADGATRSLFPKQWAELLVNRFCQKNALSLEEGNWQEWITPLQQDWLKQVTAIVQETKRFISIDRLSKSESAAATFIGIEFDTDTPAWKAGIVGDSCLFQIRNSQLVGSYPLKQSKAFDNHPEAFASFEKDNYAKPQIVRGTVELGDMFILATDALAKWIIQHEEAGQLGAALDRLTALTDDTEFARFVEEARDTEDIPLVNDDVTLLCISVAEEPGKLQPPKEVEKPNLARMLGWLIIYLLPGAVVLAVLWLIFRCLTNRDE